MYEIFEKRSKLDGPMCFRGCTLTAVVAKNNKGCLEVIDVNDLLRSSDFSFPVQWAEVTPELRQEYPEVFL